MAVAASTAMAAIHVNVSLGTVDTTARMTLMNAHPVSFTSTYSDMHQIHALNSQTSVIFCDRSSETFNDWFTYISNTVKLKTKNRRKYFMWSSCYLMTGPSVYSVSAPLPPSADPCLNGGSCVDGIWSFTCDCRQGFEGDRCETEVDECASQPCRNGAICRDYVNSFVCECRPGFDGILCERNIPECTERWATKLGFYCQTQLLCALVVNSSWINILPAVTTENEW